MELKRVKKALVAKIFLTIGILLFAFQNCTNAHFGTIHADTKHSGNGEGYSGKPDQFRHFDPVQPCAQLDRFAKPLPNDEIFFQEKASGELAPFLVRQTCQDVPSQELNPSDLSFSATSNTEFTYKGKLFSAQDPPGDFDLVAGSCPSGTSAKPAGVRNNIIVASQDWRMTVSAQGWNRHLGISIALDGVINSLPAYSVYRSDPAYLEEFRRASQLITLQPNTRYVFSFLAKPGTRDSAAFRLYRPGAIPAQDDVLTANFDLASGTFNQVANTLTGAVEMSMTPVPGGYFCSISFTTSAAGDQGPSDIGVSPVASSMTGQMGDSIVATAAQLEKVGDFCQ